MEEQIMGLKVKFSEKKDVWCPPLYISFPEIKVKVKENEWVEVKSLCAHGLGYKNKFRIKFFSQAWQTR